MTNFEPSKQWREVPSCSDVEARKQEEKRHTLQAEALRDIVQRPQDAKFGKGRGMHRSAVLWLRGRLEVLPKLAPEAVTPLFTPGASYDAVVRLSTGTPVPTAIDRTPKIRGLAFKVRGEKADHTRFEQDFALINQDAQFAPTSAEFVAAVLALREGPYKLRVLSYFFADGGSKLLQRAKYLARLNKFIDKPFSGYASEYFFSAAPLRWGDYACRVRLRPPHRPGSPWIRPEDLAGDFLQQLELSDLVYELQVQFFSTEELTPIEDPTVSWDAPYHPAARLVIPSAAIDRESPDTKRFEREVERYSFDPWTCLEEHRPLGEMMRSRKVAYAISRQARGLTAAAEGVVAGSEPDPSTSAVAVSAE